MKRGRSRGLKLGKVKQVDVGEIPLFNKPRKQKTMFSRETPLGRVMNIVPKVEDVKREEKKIAVSVEQPKVKEINMIQADENRKQEEVQQKMSLLAGNKPVDEQEDVFWGLKGGEDGAKKIINAELRFENTDTSAPIDYTPDFGYVYKLWQVVGSVATWPISRHGNFCGPYYGILSESDMMKDPVDEIDALCKEHDWHYCLNKVPFFSYNADRLLVEGASALLTQNPERRRNLYLKGMVAFFSMKMKAEVALYGQPVVMDLPSSNDWILKQGVYAQGRPEGGVSGEELAKKQEEKKRMEEIQSPAKPVTKEDIIGKQEEQSGGFLSNLGSVVKDIIQNPATMFV